MAKSDHHINDGKAAFLLCVWHSQVPRYSVHIKVSGVLSLCLNIAGLQ